MSQSPKSHGAPLRAILLSTAESARDRDKRTYSADDVTDHFHETRKALLYLLHSS
jgi:hypothetical protein